MSTSNFTPLRLIASILALLQVQILLPAVARAHPAPPPPPQTSQSCGEVSQNHILPLPCNVTDSVFSTADLTNIYAWETKCLADYLTQRGLPADQTTFYQYAGKELRDDVRGFMLDELTGVILEDPSQRSASDTAVLNWFQTWISAEEAQTYKLAYAEYQKYAANPCTYQLNAAMAKAYSIQFDTTNCSNLGGLFATPAQPSADYYLAVGLEQTYGKLLNRPGAAATFTSLATYAEAGLTTAALPGSAAGIAVAQSFKTFAPYALRTLVGPVQAGSQAVEEVSSDFVAAFGGAGVTAIVTVCLIILEQGIIDFVNQQQVIAGLGSLAQTYQTTQAPGYKADLVSMVKDTTQIYKITGMWAVLVSTSYDTAPPAFRQGVDPIAQVTPLTLGDTALNSGDFNTAFTRGTPSYASTFTNVDWEGRTWNVQLYGDNYFIKTCVTAGKIPYYGVYYDAPPALQTTAYPCSGGPQLVNSLETTMPWLVDLSHLGPSLRTLVSRVNGKFDVLFVDDANDAPACAADPISGVSNNLYNPVDCSSFVTTYAFFNSAFTAPTQVASGLYYNQVSIVQPPAVSGVTATFTAGRPQNYNITATTSVPPTASVAPGQPNLTITPGYCNNSGVDPGLNPAFTFTAGNPAVLSYNGNPAGNSLLGYGTYTEHVCAQVLPPLGPAVTAPLQVIWNPQTAIASPTTFSEYAGLPFTETIYATGLPPLTFSVQNLAFNDPAGDIVFQDNGNGTATLSGVLPLNFKLSPGNCGTTCATITVSSPAGTVSRMLEFFSMPAPQPVLTVPTIPAFESGLPNSFTVSASGTLTTPVLSAQPGGTAANLAAGPVAANNSAYNPIPNLFWLSFQDNGDGTATISGTPPQGTNTTIPLEVIASAAFAPGVAQNIVIPVRADPIFTSPSSALFQAGQQGHFEILTASPATITPAASAPIPAGLAFSANLISGLPQPTTGGYYPIPLTATNSSGTFQENLDLFVGEAPSIYAAVPGHVTSFAVHQGITTTVKIVGSGYPKTPPPPNAPARLGTGMRIQLSTDLPGNSFTYADLDSAGRPTGIGTFVFNPPVSAIGTHYASLVASNGFSPNSVIELTVHVVLAGDVDEDGAVTCSDVTVVRNALGKNSSQAGYDIRADVNLDGVVDIKDYSFVASKLAAGTVCH